MGKVIITGANGFIGKRLVKKFISQNKEVIALDISELSAVKHHLVKYFKIDILKDSLDSLYNQQNIDSVYHTAWIGVNSKQRRDYNIQRLNIIINNKILDLCLAIGSKRNFFMGSASEYATEDNIISDKSFFSPIEAYGATKAACHILSQTMAHEKDLPLNWLIISSIYGPERNDSNLITYAIQSLLKDEYPKFTKLEQKWDYIYIDDLINILVLLNKYSQPRKTYFIGSGENKSLSEYIQLLHHQINPMLPIGIGEIPYKSKKIDNCVLDVDETFKDTGYRIQTHFEDGIKKTIDSFKNE